MLKQKLVDLKDFILLNNPYFKNGYSDVVMDDEVGIINDNNMAIFPNDTLGDYFYLRIPAQMQFDYSNANNMGDNWLGIGVVSKIILVASVKKASPDTLIENLITTIGRYQDINTRLLSATYQPDTVIIQEMAGVKNKDNVSAALQRYSITDALISIQFNASIQFTFQQLKCLSNPCNPC